MGDMEKKIAQGLRHLMTTMEVNGVSVVRVDDGHVYAFSRRKLEELVATCESSGRDSVVVFVKHGPTTTVPDNGEN